MVSESEHTIAFSVGILGNLISLLAFLAPVSTFYKIYKKKSTEGNPSVPHVIAQLSSMLWICYGMVKTNAFMHITINSAGVLIETIYLIIFLIYAPKQAKKFTAGIVVFLNVIVFGIILAITLLVFHGHRRLIILGWICVVFSMSVFIAPINVMILVIRTKSGEFMPFKLSLFQTISAAIWLGYGVLSKDQYVALSNIFGLLFGIIQMVFHCAYKDARHEDSGGPGGA